MSTSARAIPISGLCNVAYTATQYALLSSLAAVGRTFLSAGGGWLSLQLDWVLFFVATLLYGWLLVAGISASIAAQIAELYRLGRTVILVSSGAVAMGCRKLGLTTRPKLIPELQAAAAIGQD